MNRSSPVSSGSRSSSNSSNSCGSNSSDENTVVDTKSRIYQCARNRRNQRNYIQRRRSLEESLEARVRELTTRLEATAATASLPPADANDAENQCESCRKIEAEIDALRCENARIKSSLKCLETSTTQQAAFGGSFAGSFGGDGSQCAGGNGQESAANSEKLWTDNGDVCFEDFLNFDTK
ncbi:hypothetical protein HDU82_002031 [Entophlyctis luteolus]|nr:hypothetical protein HDU82_002031 [Entophlyctis luteolus]